MTAILKIPINPADHLQGNADAAVILVEYGDYECPHCGRAFPIVQRVQKHFGTRIAFVFRNFPLNEIHPNAQAAAECAEFASAHDRFWQMHDAVFENQESLGIPLLMELTESLGLPAEMLKDSLERQTYTERVRSDFIGGARSGVNGTPTFFINGHRHDGSFEFDDLVAALNAHLEDVPATRGG